MIYLANKNGAFFSVTESAKLSFSQLAKNSCIAFTNKSDLIREMSRTNISSLYLVRSKIIKIEDGHLLGISDLTGYICNHPSS